MCTLWLNTPCHCYCICFGYKSLAITSSDRSFSTPILKFPTYCQIFLPIRRHFAKLCASWPVCLPQRWEQGTHSSTEVDRYFQSKCMVGKLVKITKPIRASQAAWKNYLLGSVRHLRFCSKVSAAHIFTLPKSWPSILVKVSNQRIILASFCLHG